MVRVCALNLTKHFEEKHKKHLVLEEKKQSPWCLIISLTEKYEQLNQVQYSKDFSEINIWRLVEKNEEIHLSLMLYWKLLIEAGSYGFGMGKLTFL